MSTAVTMKRIAEVSQRLKPGLPVSLFSLLTAVFGEFVVRGRLEIAGISSSVFLGTAGDPLCEVAAKR
jgi:hypothetical protein